MNYYLIDSNAIASGPHAPNSAFVKRLTRSGNPELLDLSQYGLVPEWHEPVAASLGWNEPIYEPGNNLVAIYANGTQAEREAATATQQAAEAEELAVEQAKQAADEIARVQATDAVLDTVSDDDLAILTYIYPAWSGDGVGVVVDQKLRHDGILYRVIQAHTTQQDWTPDTTPALFTRYRDQTAAPEPWVQPTGAQDAYQTDDRVTYGGQTWESTADNNVWAPGVFGWVLVQ